MELAAAQGSEVEQDRGLTLDNPQSVLSTSEDHMQTAQQSEHVSSSEHSQAPPQHTAQNSSSESSLSDINLAPNRGPNLSEGYSSPSSSRYKLDPSIPLHMDLVRRYKEPPTPRGPSERREWMSESDNDNDNE